MKKEAWYPCLSVVIGFVIAIVMILRAGSRDPLLWIMGPILGAIAVQVAIAVLVATVYGPLSTILDRLGFGCMKQVDQAVFGFLGASRRG